MDSLKYQLAIFDSDGTLADTLPWMRSIYNELAVVHGMQTVAESEYERFRHLHGRALLKELRLPLWKIPGVMRDMRARMTAHQGKFTPYPGIADALERLSAAGVALAVVSSNSRPNVERVLGPETTARIGHFDCGASMFGKASKLRRVVRKFHLPPEKVIYFGDEFRDGEAAREAGVAYGAVTWGHHAAELLETLNPAVVLRSVSDLVPACVGKSLA